MLGLNLFVDVANVHAYTNTNKGTKILRETLCSPWLRGLKKIISDLEIEPTA